MISAEMKSAEKLLAVDYIVLDNPVGHYKVSWKTVSELDALIDEHEVHTIYTHWYGDSHQDHKATFENVLAAAASGSKSVASTATSSPTILIVRSSRSARAATSTSPRISRPKSRRCAHTKATSASITSRPRAGSRHTGG